MFYFPLWEGYLPEWLPIWGGEYFVFFQAIFNLADASISTGIISIIVFQKWLFAEKAKPDSISTATNDATELQHEARPTPDDDNPTRN
jgi:signal peptidase II